MLKDMQELLERGFEVLNSVYFNDELPPVVITIMSSKKAYGHFTVGKVWKIEEQERLHEINISAEYLNRPIENTMATLMHECCHYYCQLKGIADTSQGGRYHNKKFKEVAEKRGLLISYHKYIGYSVTQPSAEFIGILQEYGIKKPLNINREGGLTAPAGGEQGSTGGDTGTAGTGNIPKKSSTRKYICPCCGNSFRATKDIRVLCIDCGEEFVQVKKLST